MTLPIGWIGRARRRGPPTSADKRIEIRRATATDPLAANHADAIVASIDRMTERLPGESATGKHRWTIGVDRHGIVEGLEFGILDAITLADACAYLDTRLPAAVVRARGVTP